MKISASNISVSRTNLSGDTFVGAGGVNSTTAASAYPTLWKWSANFAHSSAVATHVAGHAFNTVTNVTTFVDGEGVKEDIEAQIMGTNIDKYGGGFSPASLPPGAISGTLQDGATGPNGALDFATDEFITVYFEIGTMDTQPASLFFNEMYWSNDADEPNVKYNGTPIPGNIVRRSGSHRGSLIDSGDDYAAGEFISVSYDMSSQNVNQGGGSGDWDGDNAIQCHSLGPLMGYFHKSVTNMDIIFHGYVLSSVNNTNEAISLIDLPIAVS